MADILFVFAHGAGAGSSHPWMRGWARRLGQLGAVVTFDYDYVKQGRRTPDRLPKLLEAHEAAVTRATRKHGSKKLVLIGKSMGGRVGCHLALKLSVHAVVCLGYPLKAPGNAQLRDEVLYALQCPVLFVQGTRDTLCPLAELEKVRKKMSCENQLYVVQSGNHSLLVTKTELKKSSETQADVDARILEKIREFVARG